MTKELDKLKLSDIRLIGPNTLQALKRHNITKVSELFSTDRRKLVDWRIGTKQDIDYIYDDIQTMIKNPSVREQVETIPGRIEELLKKWKEEHEHRASRFNTALSELSGSPAYEIHSELKAKLPDHSSAETSESSEGYSFIHTDRDGNRFHPACYRMEKGSLPVERQKAGVSYVDFSRKTERRQTLSEPSQYCSKQELVLVVYLGAAAVNLRRMSALDGSSKNRTIQSIQKEMGQFYPNGKTFCQSRIADVLEQTLEKEPYVIHNKLLV